MFKKKLFIILSIISVLLIGGFIIGKSYYNHIEEEVLIDEYIDDTTLITTNNKTSKITSKIKNKIKSIVRSTSKTTKDNNLLVLEIPKINIKKGVYFKDNKNNNVDKNITILSTSSMPDEEGGTLILASHNGNTKVSFFKNLEKLKENDQVYIYYNGIKYIYKIYKYEIVDKVGNIKVNKKSNKTTIALISCKNGTKDKQIIYLGELINKVEY